MKVAVYSGSFNPIHKGHIAVIRYLLDVAGYDSVYLIVSPHNPFKEVSLADSGEKRLAAVREAIRRNGLQDRVLVDDIEFGMPLPSYTIRTLDALQAREPANRFTLVIGGDNVSRMLEWKDAERLMEQYGLVVYPRKGYNMVRDARILKQKHRNAERMFESGDRHKPFHIKLLKDAPLVEVSSSEIREMISRGEDVTSLLA